MPEQNTPDFEVLKPPFKRSAESERLFNYLYELGEGALVSYDDVKALIDDDPQRGSGYGLTRAVRLRLIKEERMVWYIVPNVGLQRATPEEMLDISDDGLDKVRRKTKRTVQVLRAASDGYDRLDNEAKREFNFLSSVVGALGLIFNPGKQKELKEKVSEAQAQLDSREVLKLFSQK